MNENFSNHALSELQYSSATHLLGAPFLGLRFALTQATQLDARWAQKGTEGVVITRSLATRGQKGQCEAKMMCRCSCPGDSLHDLRYTHPMTLIAPSILSADWSRLAEEVKAVEEAGADWIHLDVMDGHFVPNLTFGPKVVHTVRKITSKFLDVHLMIENPELWIERFAKAGADQITVHAEACKHLQSTLALIRSYGKKACVALNPATPETVLNYVLGDLDCVLIMTVNPGFGGQAFLPEPVRKIAQIKAKSKCLVEVDGGVNPQTAALLRKARADVLVAGSAIFESSDYHHAISTLRK